MGCCNTDSDDEAQGNLRSCTDVFWLCLYIAFWCLMVVIAAFSFVYGNPLSIVNGYDSFGNTCGTNNNKRIGTLELSGRDTSDKPYLLFYDLKDLKRCLKVCVKHCPNLTLIQAEDLYKDYMATGNNLCRYDFDYNEFRRAGVGSRSNTVLSDKFGPCPALPVPKSVPILNRCVPDSVSQISQGILSLLNSWDTLEQILGDLYNCWKEILGLTFISLVVSLVTVSILHLLAHLVSYIIMILVSIASVGGTVFLWYTYFDIKNNLKHTDKLVNLLYESLRNETAFFWYSIVATIITVIILLLVIVMRKRVDVLADLFQETSKCLLHIPVLFLQPIITFIILLAFFAFWIAVVLSLSTAYHPGTSVMNDPVSDNTELRSRRTDDRAADFIQPTGEISLNTLMDLKKLTVVQFVDPSWVKYMWWVYFIGLIWTSEFIMACQQMVIAGAVAHWYYRQKYKGNNHVTYAICKLIKYHLGSVALGSLLITLFKVPRLILTYIHAKLQVNKDRGSECAKCCLRCCICWFFCLEKFIRYLNHNAYTVIAIDGSNFCSAAGTAFEVLASNALQVATINSVGDLILFLGKCFVTAVTGSIGLYFFRANPKLTFYAAPTLLVCIFAFFVAHCIMSLYEMVLDTIYLCMCQNKDVPEGMQLQNLDNANNGNPATQDTEIVPIK